MYGRTKQRKTAPLHAMVELGVRGGIAPTHSWPRHYMGWVVSITPLPRFAPGKEPPVLIVQEAGWASEPVWTQRLEEKSFRLCRGSNPDCPVVQSVARHYTAWATPAPYRRTNITNIKLLKMRVLWNTKPCSVVEVDRHFRRSIPEDFHLHTLRH
jgi:hypothetical protein